MNHITKKKCVSVRRVYGTRRPRGETSSSLPGPATSRLCDVGQVSSSLGVKSLQQPQARTDQVIPKFPCCANIPYLCYWRLVPLSRGSIYEATFLSTDSSRLWYNQPSLTWEPLLVLVKESLTFFKVAMHTSQRLHPQLNLKQESLLV